MRILTAYEHPSDFPDKYVARYFIITKGTVTATDELFTADTFEELVSLVPPNFDFIPALDGDLPSVLGVWI